MNIQTIQQNQNQKQYQKTPAFKGFADLALRYLATNQGVGANAIDLCFMVAPRSASDFIRRGQDAGWETLRRESAGMINDSLLGVYGLTVGSILLVLLGMNKKYGEVVEQEINGKKKKIRTVNINKILTAPETFDILAECKAKQIKNNTSQTEYLKEVFSNVKAFNPSHSGADKEGYVKISQNTIDKVSEILNSSINDKTRDFSAWKKTSNPNSKQALINLLMEDTGAQSKYILELADKNQKSITTLDKLVEDLFLDSRAFNTKNAKEAFEEQIKNGKGIEANKFRNAFKKYMRLKSGFGFALAATVGLLAQPINMYITRKKTGSDGFVGVKGREKDKRPSFIALKGIAGLSFLTFVIKNTGCQLSKLKTLPSQLMEKIAFKGFWPTINQLKCVYGITIISRALSARDTDELRESLTKDILGYISWLILGDFINRATANALDKDVINRTAETDKQGWWKKVYNSSLKTRDEILMETLHKNGIETVKHENNKVIAKSFKEMLKDLDKLPEATRKLTKKHLRTLNRAQGAGYLFSGLVLGFGIPNLNIFITNTLDKKKKEKAAQKLENKN